MTEESPGSPEKSFDWKRAGRLILKVTVIFVVVVIVAVGLFLGTCMFLTRNG